MSDVISKWGQTVAERGFAQVPNYLMQINQFLDEEHQIKPIEMLVILQLVGAWWKKDEMPFPSMKTLATRCGVSERQIHRSIVQLESSGLISRKKRPSSSGIRLTNAYDLTPLVRKLGHISKAFPNEFPRKVTVSKARAAILEQVEKDEVSEAPS